MTTITDKKQYPSEQYLNELITNIEFAARAPVEVVRAMAAELQKRRKADYVEPVLYMNRFTRKAFSLEEKPGADKEPEIYAPLYAAPPAPEAIENAIEFIRSIAFHINEDDYHGKHIAHFMRQALAWLEGHSCSDDKQGKADNQPALGNQVPEFNSGNAWTGNLDIDNAIIMLDHIDTLESCDDDRIEAVKAVLRGLAGNYPVTPDGWISCSEQMSDNGRIQFSVSLPAACGGDKYFIDGVFQPLRYERDCEKAVVAAGGVVNWVK
ncbi:TPA: hypothetical protein JND90_000888 [Shigella sonnei]|nr:hypothetical protein [Shigella sonnei]